MSSYGVVWPAFWDSHTGRALVADNREGRYEALVLALYLMTCKHGNMLGCFALPRLYMQHETGLSLELVERALARLHELEFIEWDPALEFVWVREMARYRMNLDAEEVASSKDNRVVAAQRIYQALPSARLAADIADRYGRQLRLRPRVPNGLAQRKGLPRGFEAKNSAAGTVQHSTDQIRKERDERPRSGHGSHAYCSAAERPGLCVPRFLHDEFLGQIGGANISLFQWYDTVLRQLGDRPVAGDPIKFWKRMFEKEVQPQLRVAGGVDMLGSERARTNNPVERSQARHRSAVANAPVMKRTFKKES